MPKGYTNLQHILQQKVSHLRTNDGLNVHHEQELFHLVKKMGKDVEGGMKPL